MQRFLQHDALASGCFNLNHCSGAGSLNAWSKFLTNDISVLQLMCSRLESDWTCLAPKMRKSWGAKEVDPCQILSLWFFYHYRHVVFTCVCCNCCKFITPLVLMLQTKEALQKVCGCFLACVHQFKSTVSDAFFSSAIDDIRKAHLAIIQIGEWNWMRPKTFQLSVWWC